MRTRRLRPLLPGVLLATSRRDRTTTTVVIGPGGTALLVDPAWTPDELDGLVDDLARLRLRVVAVCSTHAHVDHLLWHPAFGGATRYGSPATAAWWREHRRDGLDELGPGYARRSYLDAPPLRPLAGPVPWRGPAVVAVVTDAHAPGHTSLWLPRERVLLAGDLLSDVEVPLLSPQDPDGSDYRRGLGRLAPLVAAARVVVPGHGGPTADGPARLAADLRLLDALRDRTAPEDPRLAQPSNRVVWEEQVATRS